MAIGLKLSVDEQTIGLQVNHGNKVNITYKSEAGGSQADDLCDNGLKYAFYFRNKPELKKYTE